MMSEAESGDKVLRLEQTRRATPSFLTHTLTYQLLELAHQSGAPVAQDGPNTPHIRSNRPRNSIYCEPRFALHCMVAIWRPESHHLRAAPQPPALPLLGECMSITKKLICSVSYLVGFMTPYQPSGRLSWIESFCYRAEF
jgi:hypothetical protein